MNALYLSILAHSEKKKNNYILVLNSRDYEEKHIIYKIENENNKSFIFIYKINK